jgi:regulator of sirC expression with transglutaminase-like and TPR domain
MTETIDYADISKLCFKVQKHADILFNDRQLDASLQLILSAVKLDPNSPALLRKAGEIYYEMFCEVAALHMFQKLVELYPDNIEDKKSLDTIQRTISKHYTCGVYY